MINIAMLEETFGGDKEFISILFAQYIQDNSDVNNKIQTQVDSASLSDLFHTAHTLAGALSNICEVDIVPTIKKIELSAKENTLPDAQDIKTVQDGIVDILKQMESYLASL